MGILMQPFVYNNTNGGAVKFIPGEKMIIVNGINARF